MDAAEYKQVTTSPDVLAAGDIVATVTILRATGCSLADMIAETPRTVIPKLPQHQGGSDSDFFRLVLPPDLVSEIVSALLLAEAAAVSWEGDTTPEASHRGSLVDRWSRYGRWLEQGTARTGSQGCASSRCE